MSVTRRAITAAAFLACWGLLSSVVVDAAGAQQEQPVVPQPAEAPAVELSEPQSPKNYGPLDAAREARERAEAKRREAIDRQLQLIDDMAWYSGVAGYDRPSLEAVYAYGRRGPVRRPFGGAFRYWYHALPDYAPWSVFRPWPLVPGDIYGYPYVDRVEQPLGHQVIRIGPNSYLYRPVYERDLRKKQTPTPAPPAETAKQPVPEPILTPPAVNAPHLEAIPAPPPVRGPREF